MKHKKSAFVLLLLLILLGAGFISLTYFLPLYIEKKMLPAIGSRLSTSLKARIYSIGLMSADIGDIVLGDPQNPAASIGSVHAVYTLPSLVAGKPALIMINGLFLHLEVADGRLIFPGLDLEKITAPEGGEKKALKPEGIDLPLAPAVFAVSNGLVTIRYKGKLFLLPFTLRLHLKAPDDALDTGSVYDLSLKLLPQGEEINITGTIDPTGNRGVLALVADSLDLKRLPVSAGGWNDINAGRVSIRGETEINLLPFQVIAAKLNIDPEDMIRIGNIPLRFGRKSPDAGPAITLELKKDGDLFLGKAEGDLREPLPASLVLTVSLSRSEGHVQSSGNFLVGISETTGTGKNIQPLVSLKGNVEVTGNFVFDFAESGIWRAAVNSPVQKRDMGRTHNFRVLYDNLDLQAAIPALTVKAQGTGGTASADATIEIPTVEILYGGAAIQVPEARLQVSYQREIGSEKVQGATLNVSLGSTEFKKNGLKGKADIGIRGVITTEPQEADNPLKTEGRIAFAHGTMAEEGSGLQLAEMEADIPWFWPRGDRKMTGKIRVPRIRWKGNDLGGIKAAVTFQEMMYNLAGDYRSSLLQGLIVKISAKAGYADSGYYGELGLQSEVTPFAAVELGRFDTGLNKAYFSGELGLDGQFSLGTDGLNGRMEVKLQNGDFDFPEKKYRVSGINLSLLLPELPRLRSAPAQTLDFSEATIGNLSFTRGKLVWQLESSETFFLEEGVVQWAGGRVFTNAIRISRESKEFVVPIFCDRLKLTELLKQFGVSNAQGEGTVNGRIPLVASKDTIHFEDGFLYSSPGEGGSVKVAAFDLLAAGIPKNTPQFAQVDFAAEALRNFQYNWIKLFMNTEGEDLVMQMQLDGRPVEALPFTYDSRTGMLQRDEGKGPGINQPIRLDVNFRFPLNRFLGYTGKFQDIMKKIK